MNIQYRLGMLGFLGGSDVAHNGVRNAGLLDQRAALEWILYRGISGALVSTSISRFNLD